jgi:hypothetical protein
VPESAADEPRHADRYRAALGDFIPIGSGDITVALPAGCEPHWIVAIDPAAGPDAVAASAWRDDSVVAHFDTASREDIAEMFRWLAEAWRPAAEAIRAQFEAICVALRPLAELLAELHEQYPDPADWVIEPEPEGCHHLCGRDHECLGESSTTFAYPHGDGREIPMCAVCRACAVDAYVQAGIVSRAEYLELTGVTIPPDPSGEYDGIIASLEGGAYTPTRQTIAAPVDIDSVMATLNWGQPLTDADANWPADASKVCAHICGGDHECDTRATGRLTYNLPSGGTRAMPICGPCHESEAPA